MDLINGAQALRMLREVVAEYGPDTRYSKRYEELSGQEYRADRCFYRVNDQPACIVGVALDRVGRPTNVHDENLAVSDLVNYFDDDAIVIMQEAQSAQDDGKTWGAALWLAEVKAAELGIVVPKDTASEVVVPDDVSAVAELV